MTRSPAECFRLERRVAAYVREQGVFRSGERILLMLSGGADSMAMLRLVRAVDTRLGLGLSYVALHVDYAARGADSDRDRFLVETACAAAEVPLHVERLRQPLEGAHFQERARKLRYGRASRLAAELGCHLTVTAHNRDDQAETILYRLAKYASPRGLVGIRPLEGQLARPLLCLGAAEIRAYCAALGVAFGEDVTNASPRYARNAIRLEVMPVLRRLNPRVAETLAASAEIAAAEASVLERAASMVLERASRQPLAEELAALDVCVLRAEPAALRSLALHEWLRGLMGNDALVERRLVVALLGLVARDDEHGRASLPQGLEVVRGGGFLRVRRRQLPHTCSDLILDVTEVARANAGHVASFCGRRVRVWLLPGPVGGQNALGLNVTPARLGLRHPRRAERFAPDGLGAETTLTRFLSSARVPVEQRLRALVLDVDGRAVWVGFAGPGGRVRARVASGHAVHESTRWTLCVTEEEA